MKRKHIAICENCGHKMTLTAPEIKNKIVSVGELDLIVLYLECQSCGERNLKQLDTSETDNLATKVVKLEMRKRRGKKLSDKQKRKLTIWNSQLNKKRAELNDIYWDMVYNLINN